MLMMEAARQASIAALELSFGKNSDVNKFGVASNVTINQCNKLICALKLSGKILKKQLFKKLESRGVVYSLKYLAV